MSLKISFMPQGSSSISSSCILTDLDAIKITCLFFPQCNLLNTFLIVFQINQVFPEIMIPRYFPVLEGRLLNLSFLLPIYWFSHSTT